jgi:hypothetical protein
MCGVAALPLLMVVVLLLDQPSKHMAGQTEALEAW